MTERGERALDLLVVGDANLDLVVSGEDLTPRFDQVEQLVDRARPAIGGSAAIVACGAARLGLRTGICAVVGDDDFGRMVLGRIEARGVDTSNVRIDADLDTGVSIILAAAGGRAILTAPGAISSLDADDLADLGERPARLVHAASPFLMSKGYVAALRVAMQRFSDAGAITSLDPNWDPNERWDLGGLLDVVDVFMPNVAEILEITGSTDVDEAVRSWTAPGAVVVKRGGEGALSRVDGAVHRASAPPDVTVVDPVGAGDSFDAGYLAAVLDGRSAVDSLALAVATGTLSTSAVGGTAAQPGREEAQRLADALAQSA